MLEAKVELNVPASHTNLAELVALTTHLSNSFQEWLASSGIPGVTVGRLQLHHVKNAESTEESVQ